jgi:amino acid transporter
MKKVIAIILLVIIVLPFVSNSKGNNSSSDSNIIDALNTIRWNQMVKIRTNHLKEIQGRKNNVTNDTLYLESNDIQISLSFSDINYVWAQENRTGQAMKAGALIGGFIGFGIGMYFRDFSIMGPSETHNERPVIGALVGAGIGIMVFGSLGSVSHRWDERYSSNDKYNISFKVVPDMKGGVYLKASLDI